MASRWGGHRTVVPENDVTATVDAECAVYPRLEEAWEALKWHLARSGDSMGQPARGDESLRLYVQSEDQIAGVPAIWTVYRVTEDEINIRAVRIVAPTGELE